MMQLTDPDLQANLEKAGGLNGLAGSTKFVVMRTEGRRVEFL